MVPNCKHLTPDCATQRWTMSWFIPGLGMFCEAYFIFSVGNIKQFFPYEYPDCWKTYKTCSVNLTRAPDYMQIVGIIFGMVTLGYLGDKIGREPTCSNMPSSPSRLAPGTDTSSSCRQVGLCLHCQRHVRRVHPADVDWHRPGRPPDGHLVHHLPGKFLPQPCFPTPVWLCSHPAPLNMLHGCATLAMCACKPCQGGAP